MLSTILYSTALLSLANAHGVILAAQGEAGSPPSVGFQVDPAIARNCTGISPCQQDTTIIRDAEINANIVNECGRTELSGNIDVGENTENALAAGAVTQVKAGTLMTVTIHQVNADGAGPYSCDLDQTSNAGIISQNLTVTNNIPGVNGLSQAKTQDFNITVAMPSNLACTGASTGNVCTVRCRNNAVAGPFGGCFAVQQTDVAATANTPNQITTAQTLAGVTAQVAENNVDLPVAVAANQQQGTTEQTQANEAVKVLLGITVTSKAAAIQTLSVENVGVNAAAASVATSSATTKSGKAGKAGKATAAAASTATTTATAKKGKNNNKRESGLKWAKRAFEESI
ncbi:hypothetical protein L207DRAFT_577133 [Hyaloscypha variabilis F]|uniref:Gas1-like protein n=1 Tax=Hyaloscypha variabilis (strain UAMH 11265 / GT02V1 / F) TaxID=1149755 RepID=A0A2J6S680_HYAVF|nr:hypothetical protein L207DRAFT_577133 [Hyaloscypha variabilis F]